MTLPVYSENVYLGDGVNTVFDYTFKINEETDLAVQVEETITGVVSVLSSGQYVVYRAGDDDGGYVILTTAPSSTSRITLYSNFPYLQNLSIANQSGFFPADIERGIDRIARAIQQVKDDVSRSVRLGHGENAVPAYTGAYNRKNRYLYFDDDGDPVLSAVLDPIALAAAVASHAEAQAFTRNDKFITPFNLAAALLAGSIYMFDTVAAANATNIQALPLANQGVIGTRGKTQIGVGASLYKAVVAEPAHKAKIHSADGQWWEAIPGPQGFDAAVCGVIADSNAQGTTGTDCTQACQDAIDTHFPGILWPFGRIRCTGKLVPYDGQHWIGAGIPDDGLTGAQGTALVFGGVGSRTGGGGDTNECFIQSDSTAEFTYTSWRNMGIIGGKTNTASWLVRLFKASNFYCDRVLFYNQAISILSGSPITITNIARPGDAGGSAGDTVVTYAPGTNPSNGDRVRLASIVGMTEVNGREFFVGSVDTVAHTFLLGVDSTAFSAYVSGGTWQKCQLPWDSYGGDGSGGLNGHSCVQTVRDPAFNSWHYWFTRCKFRTAIDAQLENADQDKWLGYGFAVDIDGTDLFLLNCHMNNASVMGRQGALYAIGGDTENVSAGFAQGVPSLGDDGRSAFILRNSTDHISLSLIVTGMNISQASIGISVDAHYSTVVSDLSGVITANYFRRNNQAEVQLIGNTTFKASGGCFTGNACFSDGSLSEPRILIPQTWRGSTVDWRGFHVDGNARCVPDVWAHIQDWPFLWATKIGSGTINARGVDLAAGITGTWTGNTIVTTDFITGYPWPRATGTSAGGGTDTVELFADNYCFYRGDAHTKGGFFKKFRFSIKTKNGTDRGFFGLMSQLTALTDVDPSTLTNVIGIGWKEGDANLRSISHGPSGSGNFDDLGSSFPASEGSMYEVQIWSAPFGNRLFIKVKNLKTKAQQLVKYSGNLPGTGARLTPKLFMSAGGTAAPFAWEFYGWAGGPTDDLIAGDI